MEEWVDEHFNFFHKIVVGCFVKVSFKGTYKLAEIVDAVETEEEYELSNKRKTSI